MEKYSNTNNIILALTRKCQLNCRYCRMSKDKEDISKKNLHKAIDFLFTSKDDVLTIQFFGGEPMLRFDLIEEAVRYADKKSFSKKKKVKYLITTNGLLLDKKRLDFISKHEITLMFSLDGSESANNKNRVLANADKNYYQQIVRNIKQAHDRHCRYFINMAVDIDSAGEVLKNYLALLEQGFSNVHVSYVLGKKWPPKDRKKFIDSIVKIKSEQEKKYPSLPSFFYDYINEPFFSAPVIVVDVDGSINLGCSIVLEKLLPHLQDYFYRGTLDSIKNINQLQKSREEHLFDMLIWKKIPPAERKIIANNLAFGIEIKKELKSVFNRGRYFSFLELQLSSRCQFDCEYCELDRTMPDMEEDMLYKGIDFLFTSRSEIVRLQFFGGEPLLSFDLIKKGVVYANMKAKRHNKRIFYYLATNALALNELIADFLEKNNFSIIISLDGDRETQAKNRPLHSRASISYPYETLVRNIGWLAERKINFFVNLVVAPENAKKLAANAGYIISRLKTKKLMISYALGKTWLEKDRKIYFNKLEKLATSQPGIEIINYDNEDEPVIAANSINMDYRGGLYRGCVLSMVRTFAGLLSINYLGNIKEFGSINELESDKTELVYNLVTAHFSDKQEKEKVFNNLQMGFKAGIFFNKEK